MPTRILSLQLLTLCILFSLSGCATLTRGTTEPYTVTTDPPGALVTFSTGDTCLTPCTIAMKRKSDFHFTISKPGYLPSEIEVESQTCKEGNTAMAGNLILVGSLLWAGVDTATGAYRELSPNPCEITLEPRRQHRGS
jgi:hypothetical protein